jgi:hypothetical protein
LRIGEADRWRFAGVEADGVLVEDVFEPGNESLRLWRVPFDGGARKLVREFRPPLPDGYAWGVCLSEDGEAYAYSYSRFVRRLYLLEGLH